MILEKNKAIERSVDSVARIYAIIIGLALAESIRTLIVKNANGAVDLSLTTLWSGAPAFLAFVFTLVPFWHGMNTGVVVSPSPRSREDADGIGRHQRSAPHLAKNAHRSKTVKVLAKAYANGSSDGSVNARFQKVGSL
jgi:hypothetical protein